MRRWDDCSTARRSRAEALRIAGRLDLRHADHQLFEPGVLVGDPTLLDGQRVGGCGLRRNAVRRFRGLLRRPGESPQAAESNERHLTDWAAPK